MRNYAEYDLEITIGPKEYLFPLEIPSSFPIFTESSSTIFTTSIVESSTSSSIQSSQESEATDQNLRSPGFFFITSLITIFLVSMKKRK